MIFFLFGQNIRKFRFHNKKFRHEHCSSYCSNSVDQLNNEIHEHCYLINNETTVDVHMTLINFGPQKQQF